MRSTTRRASALVMMLLAAALGACGGGDGGDPTGNNPPPTPATAAVFDGDGQSAQAGSAVAAAPAVIVKDADGDAVPNVSVTFTVTGGGGTITGATTKTNGSGIARVGGWTLGAAPGDNTLRATVAGLATPVSFTATGTAQPTGSRKWTVLVYLAADNSLAIAGVQDIDEMEAAGSDANISVVVQAEFSPTQLQRAGCQTAGCINRPNWNTFRYAIPAAGGQSRPGPDGAATDIGNRDMTKAQELREFIEWGKQNYPADHYAVVLWNHGGGYTGLIEDVTSGGSHMMSLADVRTALQGAGGADVVAFDMCLMGGFETLVSLSGAADFVTFSEEVEPGAGYPYREIVQGLRASPLADGRAVSMLIADKYHASYAGDRASTTVSAYDLGGLTNLEIALGALASSLRADMPTYGPIVAQAAAASQKYEFRFLTDLGNFMDSLATRVADQTVRNQISSVQSLVSDPAFRLRSHARNGSSGSASPVDRSTGLHVLLPSGGAEDRLPASGPGSFAAYQALYPNESWTLFLNAYLNGGGTTRPQFDQGELRFESYLVWDEAAIAAGADVDFWVLEPSGEIYIPFLGSVSPNGRFTNDSYDDQTFFEGYLTNRYVEVGEYRIYASLYSDPNDFKPKYNLAYRFGQSASFAWFLAQNAELSTATSWLDDPNATLDKVNQGAYTDLRPVASWTPAPAVAAR
ncbi:MAG TPA: clostripain-related cysteine peptidase, partial [Gemmatimonadaceae bacterium]|nr:clostripain-related cysteine peptidase [Gemmatimonadaceae bacterium]